MRESDLCIGEHIHTQNGVYTVRGDARGLARLRNAIGAGGEA